MGPAGPSSTLPPQPPLTLLSLSSHSPLTLLSLSSHSPLTSPILLLLRSVAQALEGSAQQRTQGQCLEASRGKTLERNSTQPCRSTPLTEKRQATHKGSYCIKNASEILKVTSTMSLCPVCCPYVSFWNMAPRLHVPAKRHCRCSPSADGAQRASPGIGRPRFRVRDVRVFRARNTAKSNLGQAAYATLPHTPRG